MEQGTGLFRGVAWDAASLGKSLSEILKKLLSIVVPDLYPKLDLGARPLKGDEAELLLKTVDLKALPQVFYASENGLGLVVQDGAKLVPNPAADVAKEVLDYLKELNQDYCVDHSNADLGFTRNRLRHHLNDPLFIIGGTGADTQVRLGALFDIVNSLTAIGTAVALYAVIKRQNQGFAIGFVSSRIFEGTVLMIGVISILSIVTLQQPGATGAEASLLVSVQETLVTVRNWTFVLGTGVPALNAFLLGWIMYKSRLVPRAIPVIGLIGAPLFTSWIIGYVMGVTEPGTAWHGIGVAPIFIWELSLGLWMTFKGFRKEAPLMVEAAAEDAGLDGSPSVNRSSAAVATTAGAA
jgi:hypothetical protein